MDHLEMQKELERLRAENLRLKQDVHAKRKQENPFYEPEMDKFYAMSDQEFEEYYSRVCREELALRNIRAIRKGENTKWNWVNSCGCTATSICEACGKRYD